MKLLLAVFILFSAQGSANLFDDLLKQNKIPEVCLFDMAYGDYPYGHGFDEESFPWQLFEIAYGDYPYGHGLNKKTCQRNPNLNHNQWSKDFYHQSVKEWKFLGATGPYQVIFTHMTRGDSRWDTLLVLEFVEKGIIFRSKEIVDNANNKYELSSMKLEGNALIYRRRISGDALARSATEVYKELEPEICDDGSLRGLLKTYVEHYIGNAKLQRQLDEFGFFGRESLISFVPNKGLPPYSGKEYKLIEIKDLVIQMSKDMRPLDAKADRANED